MISFYERTIGIVGFGFVGQTLYHFIAPEKRNNVIIYDTLHTEYESNLNAISKCEVIFICLPSPTKNGRQDLSIIKKFIEHVLGQGFNGIFVIKSTVLEDLSEFMFYDNFVYNPEFLRQSNAVEDFANAYYHFLGGRADLVCKVESIYREYFTNLKFNFKYISIKDAINLKYLNNIYKAYKVMFWNFVQEVTGNENKMYDLLRDAGACNSEQSVIYMDGKPGFGGKCFPKDITAYNFEKQHSLTRFIIEYNKELRPDEMKEVL